MPSLFIDEFCRILESNGQEKLQESTMEHYEKAARPFNEFLNDLEELIHLDTGSQQKMMIESLVHSFSQWKSMSSSSSARLAPQFDLKHFSRWIFELLPLACVKEFVDIFELSTDGLLDLLRDALKQPMNSSLYKRSLNILVKLNYQLKLKPNELILPLILNAKQHLIDIYLNDQNQCEQYLIELLNDLYRNGTRNLLETLANNYGMINVTCNKRLISKLAVRYWNI